MSSSPSYECPATPPILPTSTTPPPKSRNVSEKNISNDAQSPKRPQRPDSPEPNCSICLGDLQNMSYTDSCLHKFCFTCLVEWSKVRPVCPLCKARFSSIIHTIRADDSYESYKLPPPEPPAESRPRLINDLLIDDDFGRAAQLVRERFQTQSRVNSQRRLLEASLAHQLPTLNSSDYLPFNRGTISFGPIWRRRRGGAATSEFRRQVYDQNLYVVSSSVSDVTGRYRECSPQWYRNNQAQTHRLVPWLNRELNVLMDHNPQQCSHLINLILDMIQRHEIRSPELHDRLLPYFGNRTDHFQHEFYNFARSLYDMVGYDRHARYECRPLRPQQPPQPVAQEARDSPSHQTLVISSSSSDSENEDLSEIEVIREVRRPSPSSNEPSTSGMETQRRSETLTDRVRRRLRRHGRLETGVALPPPVNGPCTSTMAGRPSTSGRGSVLTFHNRRKSPVNVSVSSFSSSSDTSSTNEGQMSHRLSNEEENEPTVIELSSDDNDEEITPFSPPQEVEASHAVQILSPATLRETTTPSPEPPSTRDEMSSVVEGFESSAPRTRSSKHSRRARKRSGESRRLRRKHCRKLKKASKAKSKSSSNESSSSDSEEDVKNNYSNRKSRKRPSSCLYKNDRSFKGKGKGKGKGKNRAPVPKTALRRSTRESSSLCDSSNAERRTEQEDESRVGSGSDMSTLPKFARIVKLSTSDDEENEPEMTSNNNMQPSSNDDDMEEGERLDDGDNDENYQDCVPAKRKKLAIEEEQASEDETEDNDDAEDDDNAPLASVYCKRIRKLAMDQNPKDHYNVTEINHQDLRHKLLSRKKSSARL